MRYRRFEELPIWNAALKVTKTIYDLTANPLWSRDFGLRDQSRRAIVSVSSNIVEGFEKNNINEFIRYLRIAKGSIGEVRNQVYVAHAVGYISDTEFAVLNQELEILANQIGGFIMYLEDHRKKQSAIRNPQSSNSSQRGVVLIWAMFITMALLAAAATIAVVMASSLRIAGSIDTGVPAFYAAESCVERTQFYILQQDSAFSNTTKVDNLNANPPPSPAPNKTATLGNGAVWTRMSSRCFSDSGTPPDPCGIVVVTCLGNFKGTNAGLSARIQ